MPLGQHLANWVPKNIFHNCEDFCWFPNNAWRQLPCKLADHSIINSKLSTTHWDHQSYHMWTVQYCTVITASSQSLQYKYTCLYRAYTNWHGNSVMIITWQVPEVCWQCLQLRLENARSDTLRTLQCLAFLSKSYCKSLCISIKVASYECIGHGSSLALFETWHYL